MFLLSVFLIKENTEQGLKQLNWHLIYIYLLSHLKGVKAANRKADIVLCLYTQSKTILILILEVLYHFQAFTRLVIL